jgi:hypothetical protein
LAGRVWLRQQGFSGRTGTPHRDRPSIANWDPRPSARTSTFNGGHSDFFESFARGVSIVVNNRSEIAHIYQTELGQMRRIIATT